MLQGSHRLGAVQYDEEELLIKCGLAMASLSWLNLQAQLANVQEEVIAGDTGRTASSLRDARGQVRHLPESVLHVLLPRSPTEHLPQNRTAPSRVHLQNAF